MILTDREIRLALGNGSLIIKQKPGENAYASTSVDLTLDPTISKVISINTSIPADRATRWKTS